MDQDIFWEIIGRYNNQTIIVQIFMFGLLIIFFFVSFLGKIKWLIKAVLGVIVLYVGIVFFGYYGTEKIQKYFAFPLFVICGAVFVYETIKNKHDIMEKINKWQVTLLVLYILYPLISLIFGKRFPIMTTYIMPCPIISVSIVIYSGYRSKNKLLLICMAIWGLTGVKAFFANAYEDLILLFCGIYCIYVMIKQMKHKGEKWKK